MKASTYFLQLLSVVIFIKSGSIKTAACPTLSNISTMLHLSGRLFSIGILIAGKKNSRIFGRSRMKIIQRFCGYNFALAGNYLEPNFRLNVLVGHVSTHTRHLLHSMSVISPFLA